ncbi:MAG TPA: hypothetical protein VMT70_23575 [Vicinamibacteria bacterium]|nr:hypothetical protein [Vicinamibacteria bacterium]
MKQMLVPALVLLILPAALARADEPPVVEHQPAVCTVPEKPFSLCAAISAERNVATARLYFRRAGEEYYAFVSMAFTGVTYCGTLPGPREKTKAIEYYIQAVDDAYQPQRTSTFRVEVKPEGVCEFPPLEKDKAKAAAIRVVATDHKQGRRLDDGFDPTGVTFVPHP